LTEFELVGFRIIHTDVSVLHIGGVGLIHCAAWQRKAVSSVG